MSNFNQQSEREDGYIDITERKHNQNLTPEQKEQIRAGNLKPSNIRFRSTRQIVLDGQIEEFQNRSRSQTGTKKVHKRKNAAKPKVPRNRPQYPPNQRAAPTEAVTTYLGHLQSLKSNSFTARIEKARKHDLSDDQKFVLDLLDPVPMYSLRYSNRIFCSGRWQILKNKPEHSGKKLRQIVFSGCVEADFRSLHFEIYRMLIRKHAPEVSTELDELLKNQDIWEFMREATAGHLEKAVYKVAVQALINGSSMKQSRNKLFLDDLREENDFEPDDAEAAMNLIAQSNLGEFVKIVYRGVKQLKQAIEDGLDDAFGEKLIPLDRAKYRELTDIWLSKSEAWKLRRKDLNRLYSSYELRIMSETVRPLIGKDEFRIDLHLHDGILFSANSKAVDRVKRKMKESSEIALVNLDIRSELKFGLI
jgi:hypothetical protein